MDSYKDRLIDEQDAIARAIEEDDAEALFGLAQAIKNQGDDEYADEIRTLAYQAARRNWSYDEHKDNLL
jgi:hypothetical protein